MTTIRKTGSKRRKMYFRESSKRDNFIPEREEEERYRLMYTPYCEVCSTKYGLPNNKSKYCNVDKCGICGEKNVRLVNLMYNDDTLIFKAKCQWTKENRPDIPNAIFIDNNHVTEGTVKVTIPKFGE